MSYILILEVLVCLFTVFHKESDKPKFGFWILDTKMNLDER